jgi:outer membrane lipoprotein SlyB
MNRTLAVAFIAASTLLLAGCPAGVGGKDYSRSQARSVQEVQMGVVESVREVLIEGTKTPIGAGAGAVVGGSTVRRQHRRHHGGARAGGSVIGKSHGFGAVLPSPRRPSAARRRKRP